MAQSRSNDITRRLFGQQMPRQRRLGVLVYSVAGVLRAGNIMHEVSYTRGVVKVNKYWWEFYTEGVAGSGWAGPLKVRRLNENPLETELRVTKDVRQLHYQDFCSRLAEYCRNNRINRWYTTNEWFCWADTFERLIGEEEWRLHCPEEVLAGQAEEERLQREYESWRNRL